MPASTPIARSKTAALARVLDSVPKGYNRYTSGTVRPDKAEQLARKFHRLYGIGCTPSQKATRRLHGKANCLLVMYWPEGTEKVEWLLLATEGTGLESERLSSVERKPRLLWLGYELVRHPNQGRTSWTWRRPACEMAEHFLILREHGKRRQFNAMAALLQRLANQPGFHGVREQTWELCREARRVGYSEDLPHLFFVQKLSHGDRLRLD
nr:hypothetical protein [uncultured Pseudogulbenkiania sp.]